MIKNVYWSLCKVPFIIVVLQWKLKFLEIFSKNTEISNFMKIRPVGAELLHVDRRTDMTKLIVAFLKFGNAPKQTDKSTGMYACDFITV